MKQVTLNIPEGKFRFFMELIRSLDFVKVENDVKNTFVITEEQKNLVNAELKKIDENPDYLLNWDEIKHILKED